MFKDDITLIYVDNSQKNENGYPITVETRYPAHAEKMSVDRKEFYTSLQAGISPTAIFKMRNEDYEETKHIVDGKAVYVSIVEYDGGRYDIIRGYVIGDGMIELTCK